ncbi:unnamed protein product [Chrysodeixis includens]|uniref:Daxx histone-binding domain-containing protein n=1 Tax=Chrysodeixis includens TaxID=689277 RepID=A0A9P0BSY8_CHRIL|nr:unnamed protein product [Chrysodeixis includens]
MNEDAVIIDDDADTVQSTKTPPAMALKIETIDLNDESTSEDESEDDDNNKEVMATDIDPDIAIISEDIQTRVEEISFINMLKANNLVDKIIKLCLNMEQAAGMTRVINKTLLPLYKDASQELKSSSPFRNLLKQTLKRLKKDPNHKFLHLKTLCERMKSRNVRKVPFVTLATNLNDRRSGYDFVIEDVRSISNNYHIDNAHEVNININTYDQRTASSQKEKEIPRLRNKRVSRQTTKMKLTEGNTVSKRRKKMQTTDHADVIDLDNSDTDSCSSHETPSNNNKRKSNKENKTQEIETNSQKNILEEAASEKDHSVEIAQLEEKMKYCKEMIARLEETEVLDDCKPSPYVQCDIYKCKLIECYKRIAKLKGCSTDIAKRREIRIHVTEGGIPGPAKLLEKILNDSIDQTGTVEFPDFWDVKQCVVQYNKTAGCGWSRQEVERRATKLFRQCGETLRKNRRKREYQDMLGWAPATELLEDPAENDPQLQAILFENKVIAQAKEREILTKYVRMESENDVNSKPTEFELHQTSSDSESEDNDDMGTLQSTNDTTVDNSQSSITNTGNPEIMNYDYEDILDRHLSNENKAVDNAPKACIPNVHVTSDSDALTNIKKNQKILSYAIIMLRPNDATKQTILRDESPQEGVNLASDTTVALSNGILSNSTAPVSADSSLVQPGDSGVLKTEEIKSEIECKEENRFPRIIFTDDEETEIKSEDYGLVKPEPVDVQSRLDELGSSYVSTVFDVEDPFLSVEISSESSDDEL